MSIIFYMYIIKFHFILMILLLLNLRIKKIFFKRIMKNFFAFKINQYINHKYI
jgi:hypothetical protein